MPNIQSSRQRVSFIRKHSYTLFFFVYMVLYHVIVVNRFHPFQMDDLAYVESFCADFSFGFATKLLPGAIFNFLFGAHASKSTAIAYSIVMILLIFFGTAVLLERFMYRIKDCYRDAALFLVVMLLSGAYTFSIFTQMLGIMDTYWLLFSLLFFFCLDHRWLRWLIPLWYIASLLIHFSSVVFYIVLFSIVLLYRLSIEKNKKEQRIYACIFGASIIITVFVFFFFILNESKMICPIDEFHQKLESRGTDLFSYHDYAFFRIWEGESFIPDFVREMEPSLTKFFYLFYYQVKLSFELFLSNWKSGTVATLGGLVILAPILCFFSKFHFQCLRHEKTKLTRFCTFLMLVQFPFVLLLGLLFAICIDITRYYSHGFLIMFSCILSVLYFEEDKREAFFEQFRGLAKTLPAKIYFFAYASLSLFPTH